MADGLPVGFAGYTSYAPSKWALRGFADCLRNEVVPSPISQSPVKEETCLLWYNVSLLWYDVSLHCGRESFFPPSSLHVGFPSSFRTPFSISPLFCRFFHGVMAGAGNLRCVPAAHATPGLLPSFGAGLGQRGEQWGPTCCCGSSAAPFSCVQQASSLAMYASADMSSFETVEKKTTSQKA